MKILTLSETVNNDFIDYVASFFESNKRELIPLQNRSAGICNRETGNLLNDNELKETVKDATLIIIARNEQQMNEKDSASHLLEEFNELRQNQQVLFFEISELSAPSFAIELKANNPIWHKENKIWSTLFIPKYKEAFSRTEGIVHTELYVKFIRLINKIKTNALAAYFPSNRFTCGIDPTRKFYGEEDGY